MDFNKVIIDKVCNSYILGMETFTGYFFKQKTFKMIKIKFGNGKQICLNW